MDVCHPLSCGYEDDLSITENTCVVYYFFLLLWKCILSLKNALLALLPVGSEMT